MITRTTRLGMRVRFGPWLKFFFLGLEPSIEVHNNKGRSDLEVRAGITHWVFEFKVVREGESSEKRLEEAISQVLRQNHGKQHHVQELIRMVLIYSLQGRKFVKWQLVE